MTRTLLQRAIGLIDDDIISEAATAARDIKVSPKINWKKLCVIAACIALVVYLSPNIMNMFKANAEDPNWYKTHVESTSTEEAVQLFGDDLLLSKLALKEKYPEPYVKYVLKYEDGGSLNDRDTWEYLDTNLYYGRKSFREGGIPYTTKEDHIGLRIFFKDDHPSIDGTERYEGYRHIFSEGASTTEVNGVTVKYKEYNSNNFAHAFRAEFKHKGYIYFLNTLSKENDELFWDTIKQMLEY